MIPVYESHETIEELTTRLADTLRSITTDFEIILVEDAGTDKSWQVIKSVASYVGEVKAYRLSRNFGQHYAITCGLSKAQGEWMVVMDCDLQDKPEEISRLHAKVVTDQVDIVLALRMARQDGWWKRMSSKWFYRSLYFITGIRQDERVANFGIYHRRVIDAVLSMGDQIRFLPAMVQWVGFRSSTLEVEHLPRLRGQTSYSFTKLRKLAADIMLAYSDKPLRMVIRMGLLVALTAVFVALWYLVKWLRGEVVVLGYASLIISVWLLSGVIIATMGVVGLYIGKIFEAVKNRPGFIIAESVND